MLYENKYNNSSKIVDSERIAHSFIEQHSLCVQPSSRSERIRIIDLIEKDGFVSKKNHGTDRESAIESKYPLCISLGEKEYTHYGNTICAAAAAGQHIIVSEKEFYLLYDISRLLF